MFIIMFAKLFQKGGVWLTINVLFFLFASDLLTMMLSIEHLDNILNKMIPQTILLFHLLTAFFCIDIILGLVNKIAIFIKTKLKMLACCQIYSINIKKL